MPKPIAVLASDLHLDEYAWADRPSLRGDSKFAFEQIVEFVIENRLPIIAAGDLIDKKRNDAAPIGFLRRQLDMLQEAACPFFFIQGQHELQPEPWVAEIHQWPVWLGERTVAGSPLVYDLEDSGVSIAGIDWQPRDRVAAELARVPQGVTLLVMHQVTSELMGSICTPELTGDMLPDVPLLLIGDYHRHVVKSVTNALGNKTTVLSPGSTNVREISEEPHKHFFLLHDDLSVKSVPLRSREFLCRSLLLPEQVDEFVETIQVELRESQDRAAARWLPGTLTTPVLRVAYEPGLSDVYARVVRAVGNDAHLFFKELPLLVDEGDEEAIAAEEFREQFAAQGLVGLLPLAVDSVTEPDVYRVAERLLQSDNPAQALSQLREEFLAEA